MSVFFTPLIIFQLVVIVLATSKFAPSDRTKKPKRTKKQKNAGEPVGVKKPRKIVVQQPGANETPIAQGERQCCTKQTRPKTIEDFRNCCDSPAEVAFLDIMVQHYALKPVDNCLMGQGITLEPQFPIDRCRADFLINECLIIEIDGAAYHTSQEAVRRDTQRDKFIRAHGFHILRIPAKYPLFRASATVNKVRRAISIVATGEVKKIIPKKSAFSIQVHRSVG